MNMMNQVILEGNVIRTPLVKDTARGTRLCMLPIAVSRMYRDKDGNDAKEVGYYDVEAWGEKLAHSIEKCGWKGRGVRVVGRLKQSRWRTTDGKSMQKVTVVAEHVDFKPVFRKKADEGADEQNGSATAFDTADEAAFTEGAPDGYEEDVSAEIGNLQEAAAGLREEVTEAVF